MGERRSVALEEARATESVGVGVGLQEGVAVKRREA
jgi:hypothetical protein